MFPDPIAFLCVFVSSPYGLTVSMEPVRFKKKRILEIVVEKIIPRFPIEGPKGRPEGGEWKPIKNSCNRKDQLSPEVHAQP